MDKQEQALRQEFGKLQNELQSPDVFGRTNYAELAKRQGELAKVIDLFDRQKQLLVQIADAKAMISSGDIKLSELAKSEISQLDQQLTQNEAELNEALLPKDQNDERNAIVEIRAAAGGDEASLFAGDLYRMYMRFAEKNRYKTELVGESPAESGGFKEIIFEIKG